MKTWQAHKNVPDFAGPSVAQTSRPVEEFFNSLLVLIACALVCTCLPSVASSEQVPEPDSFWTGPINSPVPATIRGGKVVHAHELAQMIEKEDPLVIDVSNMPKRPEGMPADAPWLPLPHESIPGALWIPDVGNGTLDASMNEFFAAQLAEETDKNFDRPIVIYCHERCWLSWNAAKRAIGHGYRNVHWFPEGIEGWRAASFDTETVRPRLPPEA